MLEIMFRGLVVLMAAHLKGRKAVTAAELAEAMLRALEDMKDILRKQGLMALPAATPFSLAMANCKMPLVRSYRPEWVWLSL